MEIKSSTLGILIQTNASDELVIIFFDGRGNRYVWGLNHDDYVSFQTSVAREDITSDRWLMHRGLKGDPHAILTVDVKKQEKSVALEVDGFVKWGRMLSDFSANYDISWHDWRNLIVEMSDHFEPKTDNT